MSALNAQGHCSKTYHHITLFFSHCWLRELAVFPIFPRTRSLQPTMPGNSRLNPANSELLMLQIKSKAKEPAKQQT